MRLSSEYHKQNGYHCKLKISQINWVYEDLLRKEGLEKSGKIPFLSYKWPLKFRASLVTSFFSYFIFQIDSTKFLEFQFHDRKMGQATKMRRVITVNKEFWYDVQKRPTYCKIFWNWFDIFDEFRH